MKLLRKLTRAIRRARLRMAEQDLVWMETIGRYNIARQRAHVASLRIALRGNEADVRPTATECAE
ncbi:MAG TPA: hypothetical protein VF389_10045 [Woeseiaceae bacterium]